MTARELFNRNTAGGGDDLELALGILAHTGVEWCLIGGHAVNHWAAEPVYTRDIDLVVAAENLPFAISALQDGGFRCRQYRFWWNIEGSGDILMQITTDPRYGPFIGRAVEVENLSRLGVRAWVAGPEDTLQGKLWAVSDPERKPSKQWKDMADLARMVEERPELADLLPPVIRSQICEKK